MPKVIFQSLSCRRTDRNICIAQGQKFIPFLAFIKEKTKVGEELQQVTELVLLFFIPLGSILVHNYHSV